MEDEDRKSFLKKLYEMLSPGGKAMILTMEDGVMKETQIYQLLLKYKRGIIQKPEGPYWWQARRTEVSIGSITRRNSITHALRLTKYWIQRIRNTGNV